MNSANWSAMKSEENGLCVEELDSADELLTALSRRDPRWGNRPRDWIFRGQADSSWPLTPSAFRSGGFQYGPRHVFAPDDTIVGQVSAEAWVIQRFLAALDEQGLPLLSEAAAHWRSFGDVLHQLTHRNPESEWPPPELAPLVALAQHHGIPTRLLDWTESPLIGCYFAALGGCERFRDQAPGHGRVAVWALSYARAEALLSDIIAPCELALKLVRPPRVSNPNLRAQEGLFTLLVTNGKKRVSGHLPALDEIVQSRCNELFPDKSCWGDNPILRKFELPASEAGRLLKLLADEGVSATKLYPGVDGVVRGLREQAYWDLSSPPAAIDTLKETKA